MLKALIVTILAAVLGACASGPTSPADEFDRYAAQVEVKFRQVEKEGYLWRDSERLLDQARQARKTGRHDEAMTLARKAMRQAELAEQQAKDNASAAPVYPTNP